MAETKVINLEVKTNIDSTTKSFDKLGKSIDNTEKSVDNLNLTFDEVYGDLKPLTARMGEAEDRLYELGLAGKQATDEYKGLLNAVGNYRRVQIQTDLVVDSAAQTVGQKLGASLQGATSAFAGVQGAMGLIGVESEGLEKALLKVQSAMALSESVRGIREVMPAFSGLATMIKGPLIKAFTTLKGAIITTGIGALVVVLALAADSMGFFSDKTEDAANAQKKLDADLKRTNDSLARQKENLNSILTIQDDATRQALIDAKKRGASQEELTQLEIEGAKERLKTLQDELGNKRGLMLWYSKNGSNDQYEAANKAYKDASQAYKQQKFLVQEKEQEILDVKKEKIKEDVEKHKEAIKTKRAADEAEWEKKKADRITQQENYVNELADAKKFDDDKHKAEVEALQKSADARREANKKIIEDSKARTKEEIELENSSRQQKLQMASSALSILSDATTLFTARNEKDARNQFKINKALSLSSAVVNTALAVTGALTAGGNPIKLATGIQFVEAGIAAASGAVSIAKISATQFGGFGGGGGGGDKTTPTPSQTNQAVTPNFNIVGNNGLNQLNQLKQGPIQAYVVSGQVSTAQALDRNRIRNATF